MKQDEFSQILRDSSLSDEEIATAFGVGKITVRKWRCGYSMPVQKVALALVARLPELEKEFA